MCAVLSQANNHQEALEHARISALICEDNISKTFVLFQQYTNDESGENVNEVKVIVEHIYNKIKNINQIYMKNPLFNKDIRDKKFYVKDFAMFDKGKDSKIMELNNALKKILKNKKSDDWINFLNIGNIMYLSALNSEDLDLESDPKFEILRDSVLEKVYIYLFRS